MGWKPIRFIEEPIEVSFEQTPLLEKVPNCPGGFTWREASFAVVELISEWHDYTRRGRMARNLRPEHAAAAERRGSWGVGQAYYRIRTDSGRVFDLYYDRAPRDVHHRKGGWHIYQELQASPDLS
jgi:hypothetical protein